MFNQYNIYYDGILIGTVNALSEQSAITKGVNWQKYLPVHMAVMLFVL